MRKLTPAMEKCYAAALKDGYADPIDGWKTGTITGLIRRGLLREMTPLSKGPGMAGRHYLATDRDAMHAVAWIEALERNWAEKPFPYWTEENFQRFIRDLRVEWSI